MFSHFKVGVSALTMLVLGLQEFRELEGHDPVGTEEDCAKLEKLRVSVLGSSGVAPSLIPADYSR